jgi:hypothetical protein
LAGGRLVDDDVLDPRPVAGRDAVHGQREDADDAAVETSEEQGRVGALDDRPQVLGGRRCRRGQQREDAGDRGDELVVDGRGDLDVGGHESGILWCRA